MKRHIFHMLPIFLFIGFIACDPVKPVSQKETFGEQVAREKGTVFANERVKQINKSAQHFDAAVLACEGGKMPEAAKLLRLGANALVTEGQWLRGVPKERLEYVVRSLEILADNVLNGTEKSISNVENLISNAKISVAQEYAVDLDEVVVNVPLPDSYFPHYKAAMQSIKEAIPHLHGPAKSAAEKLVEEGQYLINKLDTESDVSDEQMRQEKSRMDAFLKAHKIPHERI
jgi:hypothetical protein